VDIYRYFMGFYHQPAHILFYESLLKEGIKMRGYLEFQDGATKVTLR